MFPILAFSTQPRPQPHFLASAQSIALTLALIQTQRLQANLLALIQTQRL